MADFMQGLAAGQRVAQGWLDTYETARRRKEERELKARREGIMSAQPQEETGYTAEQGRQLEAMATAINPETGRPYYRVAAGQGGYTVTPDFTEAQTPVVGLGTDVPMVDRVAATQPVQYAPQRVSTFLGQRYEGGLTPERTAALRERALVETITDPIERQRGLQQLRAGELTEMQIAREREVARLAQENERRANANRDATARLAQQIASGNQLDVPSIYRLATEAGADPEVLVKSAADFLGLDEKTAKARSDKLIRDIATAATSETKFNELLAKSFDPDPADNIVPQLVRTRDGVQVMYGNRPLTQPFKDTKDLSALSQLSMFYRDQITGNPLATAVQLTTLDAKRAQIEASQAQTEASRATTQLRGLQGRAVREQTAATAEAARIRAEYEALTPEEQAGAKGQGLIRQFNMANVKAGATVPLGTAARAAPELSAPVMKRYEELIKSDRWQNAPNIDAKIKMLEAEGISPAAVGLVSPVDALIATMRSGGQPAPAAAPPRATPAGQQLLGLADVFLPPPAPTPRVPTTSAERMRGLYLGQ